MLLLTCLEAIEALRIEFLEANPQYDAGRLFVVANTARMGVKRDISSGFARDWCESRGSIAYFEVEEDASQGLLGPMQHVAQEYLSVSHTPRDTRSFAAEMYGTS